ncbi:MAG: metal-independent alpha-mannosidase [Firmicutes bacterium HGW-Firmicutes-3]|jgi:hypothetical protein|nr:MAG: metal-independent alpha-mannosidase [Firmicutes bacterium HGW-Firmicutes-3]
MENTIDNITQKLQERFKAFTQSIEDERLQFLFEKCFYNTLQTTVRIIKNEVFVITGDIDAMWLRDSSAQIKHYIPYASEIIELQQIIEGVIRRQIKYINHDPYANAFNEYENSKGHNDITKSSPLVWERKYEIDSLCYPVWIAYLYYKNTGKKTIFTKDFYDALVKIINVFKIEQNHKEDSSYSFQRLNCPQSDTLSNEGKGTPIGYTGMTWSGFRPSDDACQYGYLIPANMMASVILGYIEEISREYYMNSVLAKEASTLKNQIVEGIEKYGIVNHPQYGKIYAYETDGLGNYNLMDDANVPSLLSIPYIGYAKNDDVIYQNTRKFILSKDNPYYYEGKYAKGIGSPHTPHGYVWHIGLIMQGLTSNNDYEKNEVLKYILQTDAGTGFMHEGFNPDDPSEYTRSWFAWANSIFSELLIEKIVEPEA